MVTIDSPNLLTARLRKLQALLAQRDVDFAVLHYATDLYYYSGSVQPLYLLVPRDGEPSLLARKSLSRLREEVPFLTTHAFDGSQELIAALDITGVRAAHRLAFTLDTASAAAVQRFQRLCPQAEIVDCAWELRQLRMVKSAEELAILIRSGEILTQVPEIAHENFTPGISELALARPWNMPCAGRGMTP